jgi:hypothetical protein
VKSVSAVLAAFALLAGPLAEARDPNCPRGKLCVFRHAEYGGYRYTWALNDNDADWGTNHWGNGDEVNDDVSSIANFTGAWVSVYRNTNFGGRENICVAPGSVVPHVGVYPVQSITGQKTLNDRLSSHAFGNAVQPPGAGFRDCLYVG